MSKVRLDVIGLSYSQNNQNGTYALVLAESGGTRRLPIIIGGYEAQAIAIALEKMGPTRPLTHDLFKDFADRFSIALNEVFIHHLSEGVFYAKLICQFETTTQEIDARTSDAIALAVRFLCPIYTTETILLKAGIVFEEKQNDDSDSDTQDSHQTETKEPSLQNKSTEELTDLLKEALDEEQYETASRIRDILNQRKKS